MSRPFQSPDKLFEAFLREASEAGWILAHSWDPSPRPGLDPLFSKTHKTDNEGVEWQIEVESSEGRRTGIDLEYFVEGRPLFQNRDWLERRLKIPSPPQGAIGAEQLLEEWAYREAAFKALYPHNKGVVLSDIERTASTEMRICIGETEYMFSLRGRWQGPWFMALACREV
jgi:hypothetical protein